jgi:hypothetical protein
MESFAAVKVESDMKPSSKFSLVIALVIALVGLPSFPASSAKGGPLLLGPARQQQPDQAKDKKKDKKKKDDSSQGAEDSPDNVAGARRAIKRVLSDFQDGFEGHSPRRVTDSLDERFEDLPRFEDAVTQFLERSSEMRMNFRESTTEVKADHATVIVDADMIYTDKAKPTQDQRRRQRIQFDFVYNPKKGWKIFEITPRQFFEP